MNPAPRLEPTSHGDWDEETAAILDRVGRLNIFTTVAHHPKLLKRWLVFGTHVLAKSTLPERERELMILRAGWRCGSEYEFGQHTIIGAQAGLSADEISQIARATLDGWSEGDALLLRATDELVQDHVLSGSTFEELEEKWSMQQIMDMVFTVGQYVLVSTALRTFGVQLEEGTPGWPDGAEI